MFKSSWKTGIDIICSLGFCIVLLLGCQTKEDKTHLQDRIIGVKIYNHQGELSPLFSQWKELGINTVFSSISMYSSKRSLFGRYTFHRRVSRISHGGIKTSIPWRYLLGMGDVGAISSKKGCNTGYSSNIIFFISSKYPVRIL